MKQYIIAVCLLSLTLFSQQILADSHLGKVVEINLYGGDWGNSWRGGMLYKLDTMPAGVTYFSVTNTDIAFDQFYATLL